MQKYILAFDQGTSSSRAIVYDKNMQVCGVNNQELGISYPGTGFVEQDPEEILQSQISCSKRLLERMNIPLGAIETIGITNQRETTIVWDKNTGKAICPAIVWQDSRTNEYCRSLKEKGLEQTVRSKTGLVIDSYFSASKINWIINHNESAKECIQRGDLLFGTVDTWLIWKLTGGKVYATDFSNASRTLLFNIHTLKWDPELIAIFGVEGIRLPEVKDTCCFYGNTEKNIFGEAIPINSVVGDQQAALFGQKCFNPGDAKNTYGTGCFMLMNTGCNAIKSENGLLSTIAWKLGDELVYALEGSVFVAGAAIQWLRDNLGIIKSASETDQMAKAIESTEGVYFVPAFTGLGAPYWDMFAKGTITGLTRGVNKNHIVRATLEALAYRTLEVISAMTEDAMLDAQTLKVDGGASMNGFLMQFQSDILNTKVVRPNNIETTALGAALLAGLSTGFYTLEDIQKTDETESVVFKPKMEKEQRGSLIKGWKKAVNSILEKKV